MQDKNTENLPTGKDTSDILKSWMMVALTFIFVFLYAAALTGWLKPQPDVAMITRLEPIIFVIIGYYFGRLPAQQNEKTLKDEITRQTQKTDAAQQIKEKAQQDREVLEEKIKNARVALNSNHFNLSVSAAAADGNKSFNSADNGSLISSSIETAVAILDS